ncbi:sulfite exporter TauE/SafE family protein [Clostridium tarantellae]|uniref:Probable membrane transporter protein n=1 Tax=Clostridium tarantellae TaxID=39493 RepID=A0A6I1MTQ0_9CLOT|nr:sulfite exporter TauE/SafE family protein [Clostridium tarantellae]MPQ44251.1 TSUP family transporter [Clostridium tarantellae]
MVILYFFVGFLATCIGAIAGIGGGFIISPILISIGTFSISTIGVLSSSTVLTMSIVSTIKQLVNKGKYEVRTTSLLIIGSIIGGIFGSDIFKYAVRSFSNKSMVEFIQSIILAIVLIFVLYYMRNKEKLRTYNVKNFIMCILIGLLLGMISAFLGIGGGPLNVAVLTIFFSMDTKSCVRNSIVMILFSQSAKLINIAITSGFVGMNLSVLPYMIVGGVVGGIVGSSVNKKISSENIVKLFDIILILMILVNIFNIVKAII